MSEEYLGGAPAGGEEGSLVAALPGLRARQA